MREVLFQTMNTYEQLFDNVRFFKNKMFRLWTRKITQLKLREDALLETILDPQIYEIVKVLTFERRRFM